METEFIIKCKMEDRWVPYFISMLKRMERDGYIGHSELVAFYSDGDGDFRPEFSPDINIKEVYPNEETFKKESNIEEIVAVYDAG